jgi:predicted GNAT family acetyltransferase
MAGGKPSTATHASLDALYATVLAITPADARGSVILEALLTQLDLVTEARRTRLSLAEGILPPVVWIVLVVGALITIGFTFFFALESLPSASSATLLLPADSPVALEIHDNPAAHRFEIVEGGAVAALYYERSGNIITFVHTGVPKELGGRGYAMRLAHHGLDVARMEGLQVIPICPVVQAFLKRHPAYEDLVIAWPKG